MSDKNQADVVADILGDWGWADEEAHVEEVQDDNFYIIGLDPGGTTGVALIKIDTKAKKQLPEVAFLDQVPDGRYGFKEYFKNYGLAENVVIVSEKWKERNVKGADREPQYIEGVMHALWDEWNCEWQYPEMKALIPDEFLKEQGVWTEGKRHQMDALIHALAWLRNQAGGGGGGQGEGGEGEGVSGAAQALAEALGGEGDGSTMGEQGQPGQGNGESNGDGAGHSFADWSQEHSDQSGHGVSGGEVTKEDGVSGPAINQRDPQGKRKERELGGGFIGFESAESDQEGSTLLDD